jgi:hypothetical protein
VATNYLQSLKNKKMIARFDTNGGGSSSAPSKGSNTLLYIGLALVGGYLLYSYVIKPQMDKKKAEEVK